MIISAACQLPTYNAVNGFLMSTGRESRIDLVHHHHLISIRMAEGAAESAAESLELGNGGKLISLATAIVNKPVKYKILLTVL